MKVELVRIDSVIPYEKNPRKNDNAVSAVVESIKEFGWRVPIVVDPEGVIICGHTRLKAALRMGLDVVPVHVAHDLSPEQVKAYRIADNQVSSLATWDESLLVKELKDLDLMAFDMSIMGFGDKYLEELMSKEVNIPGKIDADEIPAVSTEEKTRCLPGDVWRLGDHRLMCGDSASKEDIAKLVDGNEIHLVFTDPPYNIAVRPKRGRVRGTGTAKQKAKKVSQDETRNRTLVNDNLSSMKFGDLAECWFKNISEVLKDGRSFYVWTGYSAIPEFLSAFSNNNLLYKQAIIWKKSRPSIGFGTDYKTGFELGFYGWKDGATHVFYGPAGAGDIWEADSIHHTKSVHITEKPVILAKTGIQYSTLRGENVLDAFGGSGSTLIAAEQTERKCFLMEIDAPYCDVILKRWELFTGNTAVLLSATLGKRLDP